MGALPGPRAKRGLIFFAALLLASGAHAAPYRPADDGHVLARLPASARLPPPGAASSPELAAALGRLYIERARRDADPRFLGYAEAVLAPHLADGGGTADLFVLRATVLQSRHEFDRALADLDVALARSPDLAQAWLVRANLLRVTGRYRDALDACRRIDGGASFGARVCLAAIEGLSGRLAAAHDVLRALAQAAQNRPAGERAWVAAELADAAERLGDVEGAAAVYAEALAAQPHDWALRAAYADLLIEQGRTADAATLTEGFEQVEAVALRRAIALRADGRPDRALEERLADGFAAGHRRADVLHLREEARFLLDVRGTPAAALALAQRNWIAQKEPQDLRLLLRSARAAGEPAAAAPVLAWMRETGYEDARVGAPP